LVASRKRFIYFVIECSSQKIIYEVKSKGCNLKKTNLAADAFYSITLLTCLPKDTRCFCDKSTARSNTHSYVATLTSTSLARGNTH